MSAIASDQAAAQSSPTFDAIDLIAIALLGLATIVKTTASQGLASFALPSVGYVALQLVVMLRTGRTPLVRRVQLASLAALGVISMALSHDETLLMTSSLLPILALLEGMRAAVAVAALLGLATAAISAAHGDPLGAQVQWVAAVIGANFFLLAFSRLLVRERESREALRRESVLAQELSAAAERGRIAADLHDGLGHYLTAALIQIEAARALGGEAERAQAHVDRARALVRGAMAEVRLAVDIRHPPHKSRPFVDALHDLARESADAGIETRLAVSDEVEDPAADRLSPTTAYALWRGVQEALTNVRRHSRAKTAIVSVASTPAALSIEIRDDGQGSAELIEGTGLRAMRERMENAGGSMHYASDTARGFAVTLRVPR